MKKFIALLTFSLILAAPIAASAATWTVAVNSAIASGNLDSINQIVAKNPQDAGPIAVYLLKQAAANVGQPDKAVKLFSVAVPLSAQIAQADVPGASNDIKKLVRLANDPKFQEERTGDAAKIYSNALNVLQLPNFSKASPALRGAVIADAGRFVEAYPDADAGLKDDVQLAQGADLNGVNPDLATIRLRERTGPITAPIVTPPTPPTPEDDEHHHHHHRHPSEE